MCSSVFKILFQQISIKKKQIDTDAFEHQENNSVFLYLDIFYYFNYLILVPDIVIVHVTTLSDKSAQRLKLFGYNVLISCIYLSEAIKLRFDK